MTFRPQVARLALTLISPAAIALLFALAPAHAQVTYNGVLKVQSTAFVEPTGVVFDSAGDLFVTDLSRSTVTELPANGGAPIAIGSGFNFPQGIAIDSTGNLYVADTDNNAVKEILAAGGYTTINSLGSGFNQPFGVAVDSSGNVFVADTSNAQVKEIVASGGYATVNILGGAFAFSAPEGVALDSQGNLYIVDRKLARVVQLPVSGGYTTCTSLGSGFVSPRSAIADLAGNLYVTDQNTVKEITVASGLTATQTLTSALNFPEGLAADRNGNLFIADENNSRVALLSPFSVNLGTLAVGAAPSSVALPFTIQAGTVVDKVSILTQGAEGLDFTVAGGSTCIAQTYVATTACTVQVQFKPLAPGLRRGGVVLLDGAGNPLAEVPIHGVGNGPLVTFQPGKVIQYPSGPGGEPWGITVDGSGNVFAAFIYYGVFEFPATGGAPIEIGNFGLPYSLAVDGSGNLIVGYGGSSPHMLAEVTAASGYTTVEPIGTPSFSQPAGLALDQNDNIFIVDQSSHTVTELFASSGYSASKTIASDVSQTCYGLALDTAGNLFVADSGNYLIREYTLASGYTTETDYGGPDEMYWIAIDASSNLYIANEYPSKVVRLQAAGGYTSATVISTNFSGPRGLAIDQLGNLYVNDELDNGAGTGAVRKLDLSDPPALTFPTPTLAGTLDSADGPLTASIWNSGNQPLRLATGTNPSYPANFHQNAGDTNLCAGGMSLAAGLSCDISVEFEPDAAGAISANVVLADNALNAASATQSILLSAAGLAAHSATALTAAPTTVGLNFPVTLTAKVTALNLDPTGTVNFLVDKATTATASLTSGKATVSVTLPAGVHSVVANYTGDSILTASSSSAITVTVADTAMTVYNGNAQTASYGSVFTLPLSVSLSSANGQPVTGQVVNFTGSGVALASATAVTNANGVASVTATATAAGDLSVTASYKSAVGAVFTLTGAKAPLSVSANSFKLALGQPFPPFQYSLSGLVNGDTPGVVTGTPAMTTTAGRITPAGAYPISIAPGTLAATNYSFTFVPGTLTLSQPAMPATMAIASGNAQTGTVGSLLPVPLTVVVKTSNGSPVEGIVVRFASTGLNLVPAAAATNLNGVALVTAVPTTVGTATATATILGTSLSATFTETTP